jgi:dephospho-CoA kinase
MLGSALTMTPCVLPAEKPPAIRGWKHGTIPVIGLIGGIGGGKSQASGLLAARGAVVIVADSIGHELLDDPEVRNQIVRRFGADVMTRSASHAGAAPRVDRSALGAIVFADPAARRGLEAILHPRMRARIAESIDRALRVDGPGARSIVLDAAILLEAGWDDLCDLIVFVDAPRGDRVRRVIEQRGWSEETLESREIAQWPIVEKRRRADFTIANDAGFDRLSREIDRLVAFVDQRKAGAPQPRAELGAANSTACTCDENVLESPRGPGWVR